MAPSLRSLKPWIGLFMADCTGSHPSRVIYPCSMPCTRPCPLTRTRDAGHPAICMVITVTLLQELCLRMAKVLTMPINLLGHRWVATALLWALQLQLIPCHPLPMVFKLPRSPNFHCHEAWAVRQASHLYLHTVASVLQQHDKDVKVDLKMIIGLLTGSGLVAV